MTVHKSPNRRQLKTELWKRGALTWKLHKSQKRVYDSIRALNPKIREAVILISRRWGKSYLGIVMALEDCLRNPGSQVFIVGPSLKQTRKIITPLIKKICADAPAGLIVQSKTELSWHVGKSVLLIGAFDTALEAFRGLEAEAVYLEESGSSDMESYEYTLKSVIRPTLMHSRGRMTHLTTPPKEENHPFVTSTIPEAEIAGALSVYTIEDNPLLTAEEIEEEIKALGGRDSEHCKRELFCKIVQDPSRLVVPEFSEESVAVLNVPNHAYFITSIDFGGVKDNHAILLGYFDFERNKTCILDEAWLLINTGTEDIIQSAKELEMRHGVRWLKNTPHRVIDAPGQTHVDIKRLNFECRLPQKGKDSVEDGVQALRVAFLRRQIEIDPRCRILIQTLKYGQWNKRRSDFSRTEALGHCDALAALSYLYRHVDRVNNPIPANLGLHRDTHYFNREPPDTNEQILLDAFFSED